MIVLLFVAVLAVLILSHELGHFIFAKFSGTKVEEFGLGFPPRIFGVKKGETIYSLNWIPFGGFVKIFGEDSKEKKSGSFSSKPAYVRAMILAAGVFFNLLLAWILLSVVYTTGAPMPVDDNAAGAVTILEVQPGSSAEGAGLVAGDKILGFNTTKEVQDFISANKGREIDLKFLRGKDEMVVVVTPNPILGIIMEKIGIVSLPAYKAVWEGAKDTVFLTVTITKLFGTLIVDIFKGGSLAGQVRGPVGIVGIVGDVAGIGFVYVVQFVALFSINLAVLNLIPFPALDGGRLLFLAIEAIRRKPINQKFFQWANAAGFAVLILLMLLVTYRDIIRLIT